MNEKPMWSTAVSLSLNDNGEQTGSEQRYTSGRQHEHFTETR